MKPSEIPGEFSDALEPAMQKSAEPQEQPKPAAADGQKPDIFEYMQSLPEPEPSPSPAPASVAEDVAATAPVTSSVTTAEDAQTHTYSDKWSYDARGHWRDALDGSAPTDEALHSFTFRNIAAAFCTKHIIHLPLSIAAPGER